MPEPKIADSLQRAAKNQLLHVDPQGRVRSAARYRALWIAYFVLMGGLWTIEGVLSFTLYELEPSLGIAAAAVLAVVFIWAAWMLSRLLLIKRAVGLIALDRVDEAAEICERVARAPMIGPVHRARARQNLAVCRTIQGRHEEALELVQLALASRFWRRLKLFATIGRYNEIFCLVNVGRAVEAKKKLVEMGRVPDGEYLRLMHWNAELYVALALGRTVIDEEELQRRAVAALEITTAAITLGLLAWAFDQRGDEDMAAHLLREALDRHPGRRLSGSAPLLEAWMRDRSETLVELPT